MIALLDNSGRVLVQYKYDAWGNCKIIAEEANLELANLNPFRYRGYYYDEETGLYYLKSRYYDPETGRFISQDDTNYAEHETVNGLNLYAYCGNNPVMYIDTSGRAYIPFIEAFNGFAADVSVILGNAFLKFGATAFNSLKNIPMYLLDDMGGAIFNPAYLKGLGGATNLDYWGKVLSSAGKVLKIAGYVFLGLDIGLSIYNNVTNPNLSTSRKVTDTIFDVGFSLFSFGISSGSVSLGMAFGGPVGGLIGAAIGLYCSYKLSEFQNSKMYNDMKIGFNTFITETIPNAWNDFVNGWNWFWSFSWAK